MRLHIILGQSVLLSRAYTGGGFTGRPSDRIGCLKDAACCYHGEAPVVSPAASRPAFQPSIQEKAPTGLLQMTTLQSGNTRKLADVSIGQRIDELMDGSGGLELELELASGQGLFLEVARRRCVTDR